MPARPPALCPSRSAVSLQLLLVLLLMVCSAAGRAGGVRARTTVAPARTYEQVVLPLLRGRCLGCHGAGQPHAGLDLRTRGDAVQGGHSGPAVMPGAPEKSALYQAVATGRMPPGGAKLAPGEVKRIAAWIRAGAPGTSGAGGHWAFQTPKRPPIPKVKATARVRNPIDAFLLAYLERKGLTYSPEASRTILIRRVTYDLLGLPPTPQEVDAFLNDRSPNAYEKVVDRLLADPRYGERWARHWLDMAGYADSEGVLQEDLIRPNAWRYRDYVIRAFNADKPYDRFVREQIAGDELMDYRKGDHFTPEMEEALTATGFLRTAVDATRDDFNTHQFTEYQYRMLHDTQTIVSSALLGLTLQCTRCHDHKYEPFSQRDYYRVQAIFQGAIRPKGTLLPSKRRQIVAATEAEQQHAKEVNTQVDAALKALKQRQDALVPTAPDTKARLAEIQKAREAEERKRITFPEIRALYDQDASPPPTPILLRGDWTKPGDTVTPGIPAVLDDPHHPFTVPPPAPGATTTGRRRALAEWLTRPDHPLTARVLVNRLWAQHFGVGLVPSTENFGRSGAPPTHRALLDWLAANFVACNEERQKINKEARKPGKGVKDAASSAYACGWQMKALHRLMVTSSAYRQASALRPDAARLDSENRLLWRQRPRRLEAEAMRDGMLAVAGNLDLQMYGEPVGTETRPTGEIVTVGEEKMGRRSIYVLVRRSMPVTLLNVFDAPVMETNCTRRTVSTTATQALALMNSRFLTSQAQHFAQRLLKEIPPTSRSDAEAAMVTAAYRLAFARPPTTVERTAAREFLRAQTALYAKTAKSPATATEQAVADFCQALLSANEFVYID